MRKILVVWIVILLLCGCNACSAESRPDEAGIIKPDLAGGTKSDVSETAKPEVAVTTISDQSPADTNLDASKPVIGSNNPVTNEEAIKLQSIEKTFMNSELYQKDRMIPLTFSKDHKLLIAYKVSNENMEGENELILTGMPRQQVDLFLIELNENKAVHIGKTEFIISHAWSEDGKFLSLVSHKSVKVFDIASASLKEVPLEYETDHIYNTNWGQDNQTLYIHLDTIANYYAYNVLSKEMVRIRGRFQEGDIVFRGFAGEKILTSKGGQVGVARDLYLGEMPGKLLYSGETIIHDLNGSRILISNQRDNAADGIRFIMEDYDTNTGKSRTLYDEGSVHNAWKIFKASYLKTTGDIIYTTFESDKDGVRYLLVRIKPDGKKTIVQVPSPLYTITPGENLLHFAVFSNGQHSLMDTKNFQFLDAERSQEFKNSDIRKLMYRALDIYSSETPDIGEIKQIFINSYDKVPQEALENILLEAEKILYWKPIKLEIDKDISMTVKMKEDGNRASVVLNKLYYRGPHELVKKDGKWYITGFSTWPESKARNDVYKACIRYIENEIKTGKAENRINLREDKSDNDVRTAALLNKIRKQSSGIEVGEIELWAMSMPHRAVSPDGYVKEARVKLIVTLNDGSSEKYLAYFSKHDSGDTWVCETLGNLSTGLFPGQ